MTDLLRWFLLLALPVGALVYAGNDAGFEARYALYTGGARVAEMRRTVEIRNDGTYRYRSETRTTGLISLFRKDRVVEESLWEAHAGQLRPLRYSYEHSGSRKERRVGVEFDWAGARITSTVDGESWQMPASPGVMDKLLYQLAIMHDLEAGQRAGLVYPVADGGKIKTYRFEALGEETISTVMGDLHTLKLVRERPDSRRETVLWCAPELGFLPVRVENTEKDGRRTTAVLESVQGLDQLGRIFN